MRPVPKRRSAHVEGNHVAANGPALLLLASGTDVVTATVVGNELRSQRATGAVYLRHTDATVFTGNHCECLAAVNVVVMRPDAAPVSATGNVILGLQPVAQTDPVVLGRRFEIKSQVKLELSRLAVASSAPTLATPTAASAPFPGGIAGLSIGSLGIFGTLGTIGPIKTPPIIATPPVPTKPAPPDPGAFSLVVIGGTRVVSAGNATTAGALTLDADQKSELNV